MQGTDKQAEVLAVAVERPTWTPEQIATETGASSNYVEKVLLRADQSFVERHANTGQTYPTATVINDANRPHLEVNWQLADGTTMTEVATDEWCPTCNDHRRVVLLVPLDSTYYLSPKQCGHPGKFVDPDPDDDALQLIRRSRAAIEQALAGDGGDDLGNVDLGAVPNGR